MRVGDRGEADRVGCRVGGDPAHPARQVVRGDLAQHRVDEPGRPLAHLGPDQVDAGADRRVRRHPHREQLVGAEPQGVEDRHVDLGQRSVDAGRDDRVVRCPAADRARDQLGREGGVAAGQPARSQQGREHEVGVGVLVTDRREHVEGRRPGRVGGRAARSAAPARGGSLRGSLT